jgi:hypothetical protein
LIRHFSNSSDVEIPSNIEILDPSTVQILGSSCFSDCESLSSITFDHPSQFSLKHSMDRLLWLSFLQQSFLLRLMQFQIIFQFPLLIMIEVSSLIAGVDYESLVFSLISDAF